MNAHLDSSRIARLGWLCCLGLLSPVPCQASLVSPRAYQSSEGHGSSYYPFFTAMRYQQIHTDLRGSIRAIKGISMRRNSGVTNSRAVSRVLDLEIWMGAGPFARRGSSFAGNYSGSPQRGLARKKLVAPDWSNAPVSKPAPFDFKIPFSQAYTYAGNEDLIWEIAVWSTTLPRQPYVSDGFRSGSTGLGSSRRLGIGCVAAQQGGWMYASTLLTTHRLPDRVRFFTSVKRGVRSSPFFTLVGLKDPSLSLPICGPGLLRTDALLTIPSRTDSLGSGSTGSHLLVPWQPQYQGLAIYTQCYAPDASQPGIPVAVSNGVEAKVPALGLRPDPFSYVYAEGYPGAATGHLIDGLGVVVRFDL